MADLSNWVGIAQASMMAFGIERTSQRLHAVNSRRTSARPFEPSRHFVHALSHSRAQISTWSTSVRVSQDGVDCASPATADRESSCVLQSYSINQANSIRLT